GWFVPYSFQPSYHEFKKMCKLNELPNNEEKYNKILSYFGLSLDTLDWEGIEKNSILLTPKYLDYDENNVRYLYSYKIQKSRIEYIAHLLFEHKIDKRHLMKIEFALIWDPKRRYLTTKGMSSYELVFKPYRETCNIFEKGD
ncbi:hypothetical protein, partial [Helicobacter didelphidarum]|uniref:hypothetical protein n=1 Tax=Helicobacter didelphidarum TaxID=2040648 RepID=UPI0011C030BA